MTCEETRDLLPAFVARRSDAIDMQVVEAHLDACAECRAALAVVELLRRPIGIPSSLTERVQAASSTESRHTPARAPRFAIAAAIAVVAAGSVWMLAQPESVDPADAAEVGWAARNDPLLHGGTALPELSVGELELLLEELES